MGFAKLYLRTWVIRVCPPQIHALETNHERADEMVQWVKILAAQTWQVQLEPQNHMVKRENWLHKIPCATVTMSPILSLTHSFSFTHTNNKIIRTSDQWQNTSRAPVQSLVSKPPTLVYIHLPIHAMPGCGVPMKETPESWHVFFKCVRKNQETGTSKHWIYQWFELIFLRISLVFGEMFLLFIGHSLDSNLLQQSE